MDDKNSSPHANLFSWGKMWSLVFIGIFLNIFSLPAHAALSCPAGFVSVSGTGNAVAITRSGGSTFYLDKTLGPIVSEGTRVNNTNAGLLYTNSQLTLDLGEVVPGEGEVIVSVARHTANSRVAIAASLDDTDYASLGTFGANGTLGEGPLSAANYAKVTIPAGGARYIRFVWEVGIIWLDGVSYDSICVGVGNIAGTVYRDDNGNNLHDTGAEADLQGIGVSLRDAADGSLVARVDTDANGDYLFEGLAITRRYQVIVDTVDTDLPSGTAPGTPQVIDDVLVTLGNTTVNQSFGFDDIADQGALSGVIYVDDNTNNTHDAASELGLSSVTVSLYDDQGTAADSTDDVLIATTESAADGTYSFGNLHSTPTYRLQVDTTDSNLPRGVMVGTTHPITGIAISGGSNLVDQNIGFDPLVLTCPAGSEGVTGSGNATAIALDQGTFYETQALGTLLDPGTKLTGTNAALLTTNSRLTLDLGQVIPGGTEMTLSLGRYNAVGSVSITTSLDNVNFTLAGSFGGGGSLGDGVVGESNHVVLDNIPAGGIRYVRFVLTSGLVWVDGVSYLDMCLGGAFSCSGRSYLSQSASTSDPSQLYWVNTSGSSAVPGSFTEIGSPTAGITYNAMGYNPVNNYLYGLEALSNVLVVIDSDGVASRVGAIKGLPANYSYISAAFDDEGYLYLGAISVLYKVNVETLTAIRIELSRNIVSADIGFNPVDGFLYAVQSGASSSVAQRGQLHKIAINEATSTATVTKIGTPNNTSIVIGSSYIGKEGQMFGADNDGAGLFHFNLISGKSTKVLAVPKSVVNDGASCIRAETEFARFDQEDAPLSYGSAFHLASEGVRLGASITFESEAFNGTYADGDVDDGVSIPSLAQGQPAVIAAEVTGSGGYLQGWIDWNSDGDFLDSGEQIARNLQDGAALDLAAATDTIEFTVNVPANASLDRTFARFRFSTEAGLSATSANDAADGEVEDYLVLIPPPGVTDPETADTDGDGVNDSIDIDDDNDGVLDVDEGYQGEFSALNLTYENFTGSLLVGNTVVFSINGDTWTDMNSVVDASTFPGSVAFTVPSAAPLGDVSSYDVVFPTTKRSAYFAVANLDRTDMVITNENGNPITITLLEGDPDTTVLGNRIYDGNLATDSTGHSATGIFLLEGSFNRLHVTHTKISSQGDGFLISFAEELYTSTDTEGDRLPDHLDLDSDNDGIPDNIEAQRTIGYIAPVSTDSDGNGLYDIYETTPGSGEGLTQVDTDGDGITDRVDLDSDNEGGNDLSESGLFANPAVTDVDNDGRTDNPVGSNGWDNTFYAPDNYFDTNGELDDPKTQLTDTDSDVTNDQPLFQDLDYRDADGDNDSDGVPDSIDIDDDNDGVLDLSERACFPAEIDFTKGTTNVIRSVFALSSVRNYLEEQMPPGDPLPIAPKIFMNGFDSVGGEGILTFTYDEPQYIWVSELGKLRLPLYLYGNIAGGTGRYTASPREVSIATSAGTLDGSFAFNADEMAILNNGGWVDYELVFDAPPDSVIRVDGLTSWVEANNDGTTASFNPSASEVFGISFEPLIGCDESKDTDNDGRPDYLDLDSDNDGIPDNIEAQRTIGYVVPVMIDSDGNGLYDVYEKTPGSGEGLTAVDTDGDGAADRVDLDSDDEGGNDLSESGLFANPAVTDVDNDGRTDNPVGVNGWDNTLYPLDDYNDTNGNLDDPKTQLTDTDDDVTGDQPLFQDLDYRDADGDNDLDGITDSIDIDDDNDGVLDIDEQACLPVEIDFTKGTYNVLRSVFNLSNVRNYIEEQTPSGDPSPLAPKVFMNGFDSVSGTGVLIFTYDDPQYAYISELGKLRLSFYWYGNIAGGSGSYGSTPRKISIKTSAGTLNTSFVFTNDEKIKLDRGEWLRYEVVADAPPDSILRIDGFEADIESTATGTRGTRFFPTSSEVFGISYEPFIGCEESRDTDNDGRPDYLDLDSDNDGIPDNIEAQTTAGYIIPNGVYNAKGLDTAYAATNGLTPVNTDGRDEVDMLDLDTDNYETDDTSEAGLVLPDLTDSDQDGLVDAIDTDDNAWGPVNAGITDVYNAYPNNGSDEVLWRYSIFGLPSLPAFYGCTVEERRASQRWMYQGLQRQAWDIGVSGYNEPIAEPDSQLSAFEGSLTVSDSSGNLLFYSNGVTIWNRGNQVLSSGLRGDDSANQTAAAASFVSAPQRYIVFGNSTDDFQAQGNGIYYQVVDMSLNDGLGGVIGATRHITDSGGHEMASEAMYVVPNHDGTRAWVVTTSRARQAVRAFEIDENGYTGHYTDSPMSVKPPLLYPAIDMTDDGSRLVTMLSGDKLGVFDFNSATGFATEKFSWKGLIKPYGISFSQSGRYVYHSSYPAANARRYDILSEDSAVIPGTVVTFSQSLRSFRRDMGGRILSTGGYINDGDAAVPTVVTKSLGTLGMSAFAGSCPIDPLGFDIGGRVFEDLSYGGGAGRGFDANGAVALGNAVVEVYDEDGNYLAQAVTAADGTYQLDNMPNGSYYLRVVSATVTSSRGNADGSELGVMTYRSNGITTVTNAVGGHHPDATDAATNTGDSVLNTTNFTFTGGNLAGQVAQAVQPITVVDELVSNIDFGFNFNTVVNTNGSGQGSLQQFVFNNNRLAHSGVLQQLPAVIAADYTLGDEAAVFMIPTSQLNGAGQAVIDQGQTLRIEQTRIIIDGRMQSANIGLGSIVIKGDGSGLLNGLYFAETSDGSVLRDVTVSDFGGSGVVIDGTGITDAASVRVEQATIQNNGQYGVLLQNNTTHALLLANTILDNTWAGITSNANTNNTFSQNSINGNGQLGIDLEANGVTTNVNTDVWVNYPVVESGSSIGSNGTRVVTYDFDIELPSNTHGYRVEFFSNTAGDLDPSGHGEGLTYLGYEDITITGSGLRNYKGSFNANQTVSANANIATTVIEKTGAVSNALGATSEFSGIRNGGAAVCTDVLTDPDAALDDITIDENSNDVVYIEALDADGNPITYAISGGKDGGRFFIDTNAPGSLVDCLNISFVSDDDIITTRSLSVNRAGANLPPPGDYEAPVDSDRDNVYELTLTATDIHGNTVTKPLNVVVQDVNEQPRITSAAAINFAERQDSDVVVTDLSAYDQDAGDVEGSGLTYSLAGGVDAKYFTLDPYTGELRFINEPDFERPLDRNTGNDYELTVRVADDQGYASTKQLVVTVDDDPDNNGVTLRVRALLQGAFDVDTGLMSDALRTTGVLSVAQPYDREPFNHAGTERINLDLAASEDDNAIVDWVLLELRAANDSSQVVQSKALLIQRDGDLMDAQTGDTELHFLEAASGSYYLSLRHRNHLGVISAQALTLGTTVATVDFSQLATPVKGEHARLVGGDGELALLWSGDITHDHRLVVRGEGNDINLILSQVLVDPGNTGFNSSYEVQGYHDTDLNMDGTVLFMGPGNDSNLLLGNILLNPANEGFVSNFVVEGGMR